MQFRLYGAASLGAMLFTLLPQPANALQQETTPNAGSVPLAAPTQIGPSDATAKAAVAARQDTDPQINGSIKDAIPSGPSQK